ncbi:MAG: hypothetical protein UY10_C0038G0016 [Microgenomates group bacterium GW2011_GWA2_47_8]|nr:MAG: hypothetical protein UY10_C0038G0016 [Microgenomates group bacterium GW2011_GWA2_47_8]
MKKRKKTSRKHVALFVLLTAFIIIGFVLGKNEGLLRQVIISPLSLLPKKPIRLSPMTR